MDKSKIDFRPTIFILYFLLLILVQNIFEYTNNFLTILGVIAYYMFLYLINKRFILRYFYIIFYLTTNIFGVYIIEMNHIYLNEMGYYSYSNNALLLIVIAHIIFIEVIRITTRDNKYFKFAENKDVTYIITDNFRLRVTNIIKFILLVVFILNIILFIKVINKPFFLVKVDRFIYKQKYLTPISDILTNMYVYIAPVISIYYYKTKDKRIIPLVASIVVYLFWIGHKFSYFLDLGYMFAIPMIVSLPYKKLKKIAKSFIVLILGALIIVMFQSFVIWGRNFDESLEYVNARLAQQGQLWWATYDNEKIKGNNLDEITDETKTYFKLNVSKSDLYNSGIYKIMRLNINEQIFNSKVYIKQSRYAYSTQSTVYYYGKSFGLILFSIISAILYGLVNTNLIKSMLSLDIIKSILWCRLSIVFSRVLMQSDFDKLFSISTLLVLFIIIFLEILEGKSRNRSLTEGGV